MADQDLIALAEEYARAVDNFTTAYDQARALRGNLKDMEEKIEAMPAHTAAWPACRIAHPVQPSPGRRLSGLFFAVAAQTALTIKPKKSIQNGIY